MAKTIFEDTLNLKTVTVRDRIDDGDGKYHYEVNKNETMLAREKQNMIINFPFAGGQLTAIERHFANVETQC